MKIKAFFSFLLVLAIHISTFAQDDISLRILWYDDAQESVIVQELIDEFEAAHEGVTVELDIIPYNQSLELIQQQIADGNPPDIARHTALGRFRENYLDLRPYLDNAEDWDANFPAPFLDALRDDVNDKGLHGYPSDFTVSAPYINRDMWERAGVDIPSDVAENPSWDMWIAASTEVQSRLAEQGEDVYAIVIDRSGHRFWGPSLSRCATYLQPEGSFVVDSPGFRQSVQMLYDWHVNGLSPIEVWGALGDDYIDPESFFASGEVAFYYSGNWQIPTLDAAIQDSFNWEPVPNPSGDCGATGMVGGGVITALNTTEYPELVGELMSYLTTEENMARYFTFNNMLPAYNALAETGLPYDDYADKLNMFASEFGSVMPEAYALQYHPHSAVFHGAIRRALIDMIVYDLSVDEVVEQIQQTVDEELGE